MFEQITAGQTVQLTMKGATQDLAMRARYCGASGNAHRLTGIGVLAGVEFTACHAGGTWTLSSGRELLAVKAL